jgi:hypothetical protein
MSIWADFQQSVVIVAGDALLTLAAFFIAGAVLLGIFHVVLSMARRYSPD